MPSAFALDTVVVATANQVSADMGGDEVILNLDTGVYFGLDKVGARIWALLAEPHPVASVLETLLAEYEVDRSQCMADLQELLESLAEAKLIEVREAAG